MARRLRGFQLTALACGLTLVAGMAVSASGVLADATPAGAQVVRAHLAYRCRFPTGPRPVSVTVAGTFPASAVAGQPIKPSQVRTTVAFSRSAVAGPGGLGGARVTGRDVLSAAVADNSSAVTARWSGQLRQPVHISATGTVQLAFPGAVPPVIPQSAGTVTFSATGLTLDLRKAGGAAVNLSSLHVTCTLRPRQHTTLATVPVAPSPSVPSTPSPGTRAAAVARPGTVPKGCGSVHVKSPQIACGYITGYANVTKLNGSALLQPAKPQKPGLVSIAENVRTKAHDGVVKLFNIGKLFYRGHEQLPPVQTTFLGFGFTPITATLEVTELKPINIVVKIYRITLVKITATTEVSLRISSASVNGVPWPTLGANCQTQTPVILKVIGEGNTANGGTGFFNLAAGGTLGGMIEVPPFTHCGVGENLNPLFTASISGPRNFDLMTQGPLCLFKPFFANTCPPKVPQPKRHWDKGCPLGRKPPHCH
jgi:Family of unknown function (DUF6801)